MKERLAILLIAYCFSLPASGQFWWGGGPVAGPSRPGPITGGPAVAAAPPSLFDPDAASYIAAVETADGQALENGVKTAINDFVVGCKVDGVWNAIKASAILAGARTLNGALVPLVGPAPTNFNFVSGDYDRKTGLKGDGITKYLDSNRANNADPATSKHLATFSTQHHTRNATRADAGAGGSNPGGCNLLATTSARFYRINWSSNTSVSDTSTQAGFWGASRNNANNTDGRYAGTSYVVNDTVNGSISSSTTKIFSRDVTYSDARLAFYSTGEAIDLALLEARVSNLITAIGAAIQAPPAPTPPGSPSLWFDGSDIDGDGSNNSAYTDGDPVTTWVDKGSLGVDATQATAAAKPTFKSGGGPGGSDYLLFDGGDNLKTGVSAFASMTQPDTVAILANIGTAAVNEVLFDGDAVNRRHMINAAISGTQKFNINGGSNVFTDLATVSDSWEAIVVNFNTTSSYVYQSGSLSSTVSSGSHSIEGVSIGSTFSPSSYFNGGMVDVIVYDTIGSVTDADIETYWEGETTTLPVAGTP